MTDAPSLRPSGGWRRPGPWLVVGLLLLGLGLPTGLTSAHLARLAPSVGYAHPTASPVTFSLNMTDAPAFVPRVLAATVAGNATVTVNLRNTGSIAHSFTVVNLSEEGTSANRSWTPQELDANLSAHPPLANLSLAGNTTGNVSFTVPMATPVVSLEFLSVVPYQFQAGMWGYLNLTLLGPSYTAYENTTDSFQFVPSVLSTPAGANISGAVTFHIVVGNLGSLAHTFTVSSQVNTTLSSLGSLKSHLPLANVTVPTAGSTVTATVTVASVGVYEFVCTVAGHFQNGMYGFLYVGVPVPPAPASPSTTIVGVPILIGSAILLGVGLALALGSTLFGRFPKGPSGGHGHP